jgi:POT family proton-dependent oligopeptide transporter
MSLSHGTLSATPDNEPLDGTSRPQRGTRSKHDLVVLCIIEGCERFAAASLGSLFVLYMIERRGASPAQALRLIGLFNALCYLSPLVGGALSDRFFGARRTMLLGTFAMTAAYAALSFGLSPSLILILLMLMGGHGLFKPSINSLLGTLYRAGDVRREAAHTWFYFAANLGSMLAPLVAGVVHVRYGWNAVFAVAACSMALCIPAMLASLRVTSHVNPGPERAHPARVSKQRIETVGKTGVAAVVATVVVSGAAFAQCDGVLLLWARDDVQRVWFGREIPVPWLAALPALLVLALSPVLAFVHGQAIRCGQAVPAPRKILAGLRCIGLAFVLLAVASRWQQPGQLISPVWMVAAYVLLTIGELLVLPITQALLVELAPASRVGLASGLWFAALASGHGLAGLLGASWTILPHVYFFMGFAILVSAVGSGARRCLLSDAQR